MLKKIKIKLSKFTGFVFLFFLISSVIFAGFGCKPEVSEKTIEINQSANEEKTDTSASSETGPPETTIATQTSQSEDESVETSSLQEDTVKEDLVLKIESPAFANNEKIPSKYTCDGENINPALNITGVPEDAVSLVLIVDDPDAPGGTWVHWTVFNISPDTTLISENSAPDGAKEGVTDFGTSGYNGPCPPSGTHRYFFKLFALDTTLELDSNATTNDIMKAIENHIIGSAEIIGTYSND